MFKKYDLEIISADNDKKYKTHDIDGLNTIGVYENEPFKIRFRNNTAHKVQVRVSVDGTDILTGDEAHTRTDGQMWVVGGYDILELKAWPEDNNGGAEFLFGKEQNSVAANTHGNMLGKGLIAVAVFEETQQCYYRNPAALFSKDSYIMGFSSNLLRSNVRSSDASYSSDSLSLEEGPAVGAGDYQEQKITKTAGLRNPKLSDTITVKYEWWLELRSKLRNVPQTPTAFPGDKKNIDLKSTPRLETPQGIQKRFRKRIRRSFVDSDRLKEKYVEYERFG